MSIDPEIGGPSAEDRQQIYAQMQLSAQNISQIENMISESGVRPVARAALTNVRVRHNSIKNGKSRVVESHTCELVFAYELELDPDVIGYYVQVPCRRVRRTTQYGRQHISTAHIDFLVFRSGGIELVECKQQSWLEKQLGVPDSRWSRTASAWSYPPYADWAAQHGLAFSVWAPPDPAGVYLQNLEACYAVSGDSLDSYEKTAVAKVAAVIRKHPASIETLAADVHGFNERLALWMLANSIAFGPWRSTPVHLGDRFQFYGNPAQAKQVDEALLHSFARDCAQPEVVDPLLSASATDLARARERLARLELIEAGQLAPTRRMLQLARQVRKAVTSGQSPLSACLTRYAQSGNRTPRLLPEHEQAIDTVIAKYWNTGKARRPQDLLYVFEKECQRLGIEPCGRSRLDARRRSENPRRHALATGGFRAYHAVRSSTDPRSRSLTPIGYGQVLHIDSSDLDVRCAPDLMRFFPAAKAKFYIGMDAATGDTMAHALIFGPARTDGLALLMREYVKRHSFLPKMIHVDRGPENTSHWIEEFCEGRISLRHSPTAASAWNGIAENAIKQVNDQVAHRMVGSTAPDQKGRKVDGKFKSRSNARTSFTAILEHFIAFAYQDMPSTPRAGGQTPIEKRDEAVAAYGVIGTPCEWNDDFLIQTSIRVPQRGKPNAQRGIRTADGWFVSDELLAALRTAKTDQVRSDCCYPDVLYVQIGGCWIKAFHNRVQSAALLSDSERLFRLLSAPTQRAESRRRKDDISRVRHSRYQLAEVAHPATHHLAPEPPSKSEAYVAAQETDAVAPEARELLPFDEREDY